MSGSSSASISSPAGSPRRPDPRAFRSALDALGRPADETVFVDDWPEHVEAANRLGIRGIWLRNGTDETIAGLDAISDLRDLLDIIP
jgi:putative hydrolase of the HAD superfamily